MKPLIAKLLEERPVLLDGAWGTELYARGLSADQPPEVCNLWPWVGEAKDEQSRAAALVERVARDYVEAGSRIILTNTFGGNRLRLAAYGLQGGDEQVNRSGAELSVRAARAAASDAGGPYVFGAIGPTGVDPSRHPADERAAAFFEQAQTLIEAGLDGLVLETMTLEEALVALEALVGFNMPTVASLAYLGNAGDFRSLDGHRPEEAAKALEQAGADVIGANCTDPTAIAIVSSHMGAASSLPLWMKPNAGLPSKHNNSLTYDLDALVFGAIGAALADAGVAFVGGCCGVGPAHIRELKRALARIQK